MIATNTTIPEPEDNDIPLVPDFLEEGVRYIGRGIKGAAEGIEEAAGSDLAKNLGEGFAVGWMGLPAYNSLQQTVRARKWRADADKKLPILRENLSTVIQEMGLFELQEENRRIDELDSFQPEDPDRLKVGLRNTLKEIEAYSSIQRYLDSEYLQTANPFIKRELKDLTAQLGNEIQRSVSRYGRYSTRASTLATAAKAREAAFRSLISDVSRSNDPSYADLLEEANRVSADNLPISDDLLYRLGVAKGEISGTETRERTQALAEYRKGLADYRTSEAEARQERHEATQENIQERFEETQAGRLSEGEEKIISRGIENWERSVKPLRERLDQTTTVDQVLSLAKDNPTAAAASRIAIARLAGEKGVLSDFDIRQWGGSQAILDRIEQTYEMARTGRLTEENRQWLMEVSNAINDSLNRTLRKRAWEHAKRIAKAKNRKGETFASAQEVFQRIYPGESPPEEQRPAAETPPVEEPTTATQANKVIVSDGKETLAIDPADLAEAEADGFKRIQ